MALVYSDHMQMLDYINASLVVWTSAVQELLFVWNSIFTTLALPFCHGLAVECLVNPLPGLQLLICSRQPLSDHAFEFCRWGNCISL